MSKQHSITGVYCQLAGLKSGRIVPMAMIPPDCNQENFMNAILVPQLALLSRGLEIAYQRNFSLFLSLIL